MGYKQEDNFNFQKEAGKLLNYLLSQIDDGEMDGEVLTISTAERKQYILNKHRINQEIWLSSPLSGPHHFSYHNGRWISKKHHIDLLELIKAELKVNLDYEYQSRS